MYLVNTLSWFPFSLLAVLLFGVSMVLYKLPSVKGHSKTATAFWSMFFSFVLSLVLFVGYLSDISGSVLFFGLLWGAGFASLSILQMYALEHVDTNVLFPTTSVLSLVAAILFGLFFLSDTVTLIQLVGVMLTIFVVYMFVYKGGRFMYSAPIMYIGAGVVFLSAFNKIIQKIAVDAVDLHALQIAQYLLGAIFALLIFMYQRHKSALKEQFYSAIKPGLYISVPSFLGGYAFLTALSKGPFTLITSIHSTYIFVTALLGAILFGEHLTKKKLLLVSLAIIAIILIKIG